MLIVGCGDSDAPDIDASTRESLAESLGCGDISELDPMLAPSRGRGATSVISREIDARPSTSSPELRSTTHRGGSGEGGTDENIRRLLGADPVDPVCELAVLVSDDVFVVETTVDLLADVGVSGDEPIPVSPTVSYLDRCALGRCKRPFRVGLGRVDDQLGWSGHVAL